MTTARNLIIAKIAHLDGTEQLTRYDDHNGDVVATLVVRTDRGVSVELSWRGDDGTTSMPTGVYDDLDSADTDEIDEAIADAIDAEAEVSYDWSEASARIDVTVSTHTTPRDGDGGGIRYTASTRVVEAHKAIEISDAGHRAHVRLSLIDDARAGDDVTGYVDDQRDEQQERDAHAALIRLGDAIGYCQAQG